KMHKGIYIYETEVKDNKTNSVISSTEGKKIFNKNKKYDFLSKFLQFHPFDKYLEIREGFSYYKLLIDFDNNLDNFLSSNFYDTAVKSFPPGIYIRPNIYDFQAGKFIEEKQIDYKKENIEIREYWDKLSKHEKIEVYDFIKTFSKLCNKNIPELLEKLLSNIHIPKTRKVLQNEYFLIEGDIKPEDNKNYYNLLNHFSLYNYLDESTENIIKYIDDIKTNIKFYFFWKEESILLKTIDEIVKENHIFTYDEISDLFNKLEDKKFKIIKTKFFNSDKESIKIYLWILQNGYEFGWESEEGAFSNIEDIKNNYLNLLNYFLNIVGINKIFVVEKNNNIQSFYTINNEETNKLKINASYESSGFHQLLPIIMSLSAICTKESEDNCIYNGMIMEQPELHLHPKLQANLASLFIDSLKLIEYKEEDFIDSNINIGKFDRSNCKKDIYKNIKLVVIETHSEHIIRKIQVLIAQGKMDKEKVSVNYLYMENGSTKVKPMKIDEDGFLKEIWPDGFFDESYKLTKELLFANKN
ncbi:MAG: DUF3696 domain-containing protein, partial [Ignavibacteriae bacterium]|nr:DUF3696 domain-containing protein [Ignavibacteriota bacterium]